MAVDRSAWANWIADAKEAESLPLAERLGARLKKSSRDEWEGPCPADGGRDRFAVNPKKKVFLCRGVDGGDNIAMVQHVLGCNFNEACEYITGRPRPDNSRDETPEERQERLRDYAKRQAENRERREAEEREEASRQRREEQHVSEVIDRAVPIASKEGAYGMRYLREARGLTPKDNLLIDLKFVPDLDYWGLPDNTSDNPVKLATLPAVIAVIREVYASVIGFSATYLDPKEPRKWTPPNYPLNSAKKTRGDKRGGLIRLGRLKPIVAIAEGWENALAWHQLGHGPEDVSLAAAVDLNNLAGTSAGTIDHRWLRDNPRPRRIPNAMPNPNAPGMILPEGIRSVILLGDSDSEFCMTRAHVATAVYRLLDHGIETSVHFAPPGGDWNEILLEEIRRAAA